jgi:5-methyltetrahydropteroyltriglutamate--homocysteine methyltransferase
MKSVSVSAFIHGLYPRSEKLVAATRGIDRGRVTPSQLRKVQKSDRTTLIKLQKQLQCSFLEDGKIDWQDYFRPFVENSAGLKAGPLTRYFDNNTFFRQPQVTGTIKFNLNQLKPYFPKLSPNWKVSLPSPFFFAKLSSPKKNWEKTLKQFTLQLNKLARTLVNRGVSFIQLNDPYLGYHSATQKEIGLLRDMLEEFVKGLKATTAYHVYFGNAAPIFKYLLNFPVDAIGFDAFTTPLEELPVKPIDQQLILGCLDARTSSIEKKTVLKSYIKKILHQLKPSTVYLTPNASLEFLTVPLAQQKIKRVAQLAQELKP